MPVGIESIISGPRMGKLDAVLEVVASCGFEGVEFSQHPGMLPPIDELLEALQTHELEFIGLARGSLDERVEYCGDYSPDYLYVDVEIENDGEPIPAVERAGARGHRLALQPHMFRPLGRFSRARELLNRYQADRLAFIMDTAHLDGAGDDPLEVIDAVYDRICSVHLKDRLPEYGVSSHRYARGFVGLGRGALDLSGVVAELRQRGFLNEPAPGPDEPRRWVIYEQDHLHVDPATDVRPSAAWMQAEGLLELRAAVAPDIADQARPRQPDIQEFAPGDVTSFLDDVIGASTLELSATHDRILAALNALVPSHVITLWSC